MTRLEISKNIFLHLLLPTAGIVLACYGIYHFFGSFALTVTMVLLYAFFAFTAHMSKRKTITEITKQADSPISSYDLACLVMKCHQTSPDSDELTKLISKLVVQLKYEHSGKVENK